MKAVPTNRRALRHQRKSRITPEAIAAWQSCDERALACALGLDFWGEPSPLPAEIVASGVSPKLYRLIQQLPHVTTSRTTRCSQSSASFLQIAGWPDCREAYKRNLAEAEEDRDYYALLLRDPDARYQGTGMDTSSLRRRLKEAKEEVAYRKKLLADLGGK